jgi:hypothetical protein
MMIATPTFESLPTRLHRTGGIAVLVINDAADAVPPAREAAFRGRLAGRDGFSLVIVVADQTALFEAPSFSNFASWCG